MTALGDWIRDYMQALPPVIRPDPGDQRFITAARQALDNQWTPAQAAAAVCGRSYTGARNAVVLALHRLEQIAAAPARTTTRTTAALNNGCLACPPGAYCPDPVLTPATTGQIREVRAVVNKLIHATRIPD